MNFFYFYHLLLDGEILLINILINLKTICISNLSNLYDLPESFLSLINKVELNSQIKILYNFLNVLTNKVQLVFTTIFRYHTAF